MKHLLTVLSGALLMGLLASPALAIEPGSTDPVAIMQAVEGRTQGDRMKSRMSMTITDAADRQRTRTVQTRTMDFEGGRKQILMFESPADVQGTGMLSVDYDSGAKDDDQWLYLPSLHKSTRISSGEKSGSFMGTDLSFSDMTKADPTHYEYKILKQSVPADGDDCWLIEARPKTQKAKDETGYLKTRLFISKSKLLPIKTKAWVIKGKKLKYIGFKDFKQIEGVWIAHTITAQTKKDNAVESTTVIQFSDMSLNNADVVAGDFTQRRLEKGL
jgi:outer membrane lipoprotein-sorting protein